MGETDTGGAPPHGDAAAVHKLLPNTALGLAVFLWS